MADYTKLLDHYLYDLSEDADLIAEAIATLENLFDHRDRQELMYFSRPTAVSYLALKKAQKLLKDQQHEIWELQELNEHLTDQQKKIRMFVDSKGEVHPLEPEPVEPKEETNSNNLHGSFWTCGKCGQAMTVSKGFVRYCWNCGTPVKWD